MGPLKGKKLPHFKIRCLEERTLCQGLNFLTAQRWVIFEAEKDRLERELKEIDCKEATARVTKDLLGIYKIADVATINPLNVKKKVEDLWRMRRAAKIAECKGQTGERKRKSKNGKVKRTFDDIANKLFEIADEKKCSKEAREFLKAQSRHNYYVVVW